MADETPGSYALQSDRGLALGNSEDVFVRRALHVKVGNSNLEAIPVFVTSARPQPPESEILNFNSISAVVANVTTALISYTVPPAKTFYLQRVNVGGDNIATYDLSINATLSGRRRTYFGGALDAEFVYFNDPDERGILLNAGDTVSLTVVHARPFVGSFEAEIIGTLVG